MARWCSDGDESGSVSRRRFLRTSLAVGGGGLVGSAIAAEPVARERGPRAGARSDALDIRDFGALGDGRTHSTRAIQRAIDAAHRAGGGTVRLPAGEWLSGSLRLRSRVTLELGTGAVLVASADDADFAARERLPFSTGSDRETTDFTHALLAGRDLEHVAVCGHGTIDMNRSRRGGPKPIALKRCRFVTISDVTIVHAPNYCVSLAGCEDVVVDGVTIREAYADGIDPDCCRRVRVVNCDVESDDDALCLKASFALGVRGATEDVIVANCRLRSPSNCFKLGTESTGDFRRIVLSNCIFRGMPPVTRDVFDVPDVVEGGGVAIESVDGGTVDGVVVSNVVMEGVEAPIFVRLGDRGRDRAGTAPGRIRNVSLRGIVASGAAGTATVAGLVGHPIERLTIDDVHIGAPGGAGRRPALDVPELVADYPKAGMFGPLPAFGLYLRHARDVMLRNVELGTESADDRPALIADDVSGLQLTGLVARTGEHAGPVVWLNDVRGGFVHGNVAPEEASVFLRVTGERTRSVAVTGNAYWTPGPVELAPELAPEAVVQAVATEPAAARAKKL